MTLPDPERLAAYHSSADGCRCPDRRFRGRVCKHMSMIRYIEQVGRAAAARNARMEERQR